MDVGPAGASFESKVVWRPIGDQEHFAVGLGLESYNANELCPWCRANRSTNPWTAFAASYPPRVGQLPPHPFLHLPGIGRTSVAVDLLHCVDLGVANWLVAGVLGSLYSEAGHSKQWLRELWGLIQTGYQVTSAKQRLDYLGPSTFLKDPRSPDAHFPRWRGKGAETKSLVPARLWAVHQLPGQESAFAQTRKQALIHLAAFYLELQPHRELQVLAEEVVVALKRHTAGLLACLTQLSLTQTGLYFNIVPKHHYMLHLVEQARCLNPTWTHCYGEEDLVGKAVKAAAAASLGHSQEQVAGAVLKRYRVLLALYWKGSQGLD